GAARRGAGHRARRRRLLIGARPDVDVAVMEESPLVAYRPVVAGPGLDDEIHGLPLALVHAHRIAVGREYFVWGGAHAAAFEPAPREHVHHRHLLRDAHGLAAVGDRVSQDQEPRLLGYACQREERTG